MAKNEWSKKDENVLGHIFFSYLGRLPPNSALRIGFEYFSYDISDNSSCLPVFEKVWESGVS